MQAAGSGYKNLGSGIQWFLIGKMKSNAKVREVSEKTWLMKHGISQYSETIITKRKIVTYTVSIPLCLYSTR